MQQASDAGGAMLAEAHAEAERLAYEVDATREQLQAAKAALKQGSHACLMLKIGWRSIGTLALRLMLNEWRAAASQIEHQREAAALREEARATHGKLALLKEHKSRQEETMAGGAGTDRGRTKPLTAVVEAGAGPGTRVCSVKD